MYGKLTSGKLSYVNGKRIRIEGGIIINPTIEQLNAHGVYEVVNVEDEGTDRLDGGVIYHYVGAPVTEEGI